MSEALNRVNLLLVFCAQSFSQAIIDHYSAVETDDMETFLLHNEYEFVEKKPIAALI